MPKRLKWELEKEGTVEQEVDDVQSRIWTEPDHRWYICRFAGETEQLRNA
jgi:hypothetical protein